MPKLWQEKEGFVNNAHNDWSPHNCEPNLIENLWRILKRDIYCDGKQFNNKNDVWGL